MKNIKKRNWAFVCYPDSLPSNWQDILIESGIPFAISPLHDKDINPDNTIKKPHYHVILSYDNTTTYNNVVRFLEPFNCPIPQPLESVKGYYRYLTHKDNPEKYQYDESDILCFNGFDSSNFTELTKSQIDAIKYEIIDFILENNILEYSDLIEVLHTEETINYWLVATSNTLFFNHYITSRRHRIEKHIEKENNKLIKSK